MSPALRFKLQLPASSGVTLGQPLLLIGPAAAVEGCFDWVRMKFVFVSARPPAAGTKCVVPGGLTR